MSSIVEVILLGKDELSGVTDKATGALGGLGKIAGGALKIGLGAATVGIGALATGLGIAFKEAVESQEVQAQLAAVLKSTAGAAGVTADMANNLASELSKVTRYSDEQVLSGENMLLTFTNIGKDVFPQATQALVDMAAAMGTDVKSGAIQLGKALNDPIAGVSALSRVGVTFTEEQKAVIQKLVETGQTAEAQKLILAELNKEFGGSAAEAGNTFAGTMDRIKNRLLNVAEGIGNQLLPKGEELLNTFVIPGIEWLEKIASSFDINSLKLNNYSKQFQPVIDAGQNLLAAFSDSFPKIQAFVNDAFIFIKNLIATTMPNVVENVSSALNSLATFWRAHGDEIMAVVNFAFRVIAVTIGGTIQLITGLIALGMAAINGDWSGAWKIAENTVKSFFNAALSIVGTNLDEFKKTWANNLEAAKIIISTAFDNIKTAISNKISEWVQLGRSIVNGIKQGLTEAVGGLIAEATRIAQAALDAIKTALGIHSPSTVFKAVGKNIALGLSEGINSGTPMVVGAVSGLANQMVSNSVNNYNLTINSNARSEQVATSFGIMKAVFGG